MAEKQLVHIVNKVNNSKIRRITNGRGDEVIVVPSYTLPDNIEMNGIVYPAEEIEKGYKTLEGKPAPFGHPQDEDGNYVSANSSDSMDYYYVGAVNRNVQRVKDTKHGHRVYAEKHINVPVAERTEYGRELLKAIEDGKPIHTSTGVMITLDESTDPPTARDLQFDHDSILLNEEGAATPEQGVGLMVNKAYCNVSQDAVESGLMAKLNQIFNMLKPKEEDTPEMAYQELIDNALKEAGIDASEMTEEQKLEAYAANKAKPSGDVNLAPKGETVPTPDITAVVNEAVKSALAANKAESEKADRAEIAEQLKTNGVELSEAGQSAMSVNELRAIVKKTSPAQAAYGLPGGVLTNSNDFGGLPDVEVK